MATAALSSPSSAAVRADADVGPVGGDRKWALRWAYFFLCLFAAFALMPPIYMLITGLKKSSEISAATNPWWVYHPTLGNFVELLTSRAF